MRAQCFDRLPDESDWQWQAFKVYRDMGTNRTFKGAYQQLLGDEIEAVARVVPCGAFNKAKVQFDWKSRATRYDAEQARVKAFALREKFLIEVEKATRRAVKLASIPGRLFEAIEILLRAGTVCLSVPVLDLRIVDGIEVYTPINPRFGRRAVKFIMAAAGLAAEHGIVEVVGAKSALCNDALLAKLEIEPVELERFRKEFRDLPEKMLKRGNDYLTLPLARTVIENGAKVVKPAQSGHHLGGRHLIREALTLAGNQGLVSVERRIPKLSWTRFSRPLQQ